MLLRQRRRAMRPAYSGGPNSQLRLLQSPQCGSIAREALNTETARIDSEIAAIEKTQQLTTSRS